MLVLFLHNTDYQTATTVGTYIRRYADLLSSARTRRGATAS